MKDKYVTFTHVWGNTICENLHTEEHEFDADGRFIKEAGAGAGAGAGARAAAGAGPGSITQERQIGTIL